VNDESVTPSTNEVQVQADTDSPELYCASSMAELEISCSSAQSCSDGPCPKGLFCFPFICDSIAKDEPIDAGGETFYCATDLRELDERCGLATECTTRGDCPQGKSCLRYDCKQSIDRCPLNYVGLHSSKDCRSYYECSNGVASNTNRCGDSLKFDKVRGHCVSEGLVNQYCYGSPLSESDKVGEPGTYYCASSMAELDEKCGLATECTGSSDDCPKGQSCLRYICQQSLDLCPLNYIGWHSTPDCMIYYGCTNGIPSYTNRCEESYKFDKFSGSCVSEDLVDQYCYRQPVLEMEEEGDVKMLTCPEGFVGWQSSYGDCKEYYECKMDGSMGPIYVCTEGMKFDKSRKMCSNEVYVNDFCYGPALETATSNGAGNESSLESGKSSVEDAGNPSAITPSQPHGQNQHQAGAESAEGHVSGIDSSLGESYSAISSSPSPTHTTQTQTTLQPKIASSTYSPTFGGRPLSPSYGGDDLNNVKVQSKSGSPITELPPWYHNQRIDDLNEGERTAHLMNTFTWLALLASIFWIINI